MNVAIKTEELGSRYRIGMWVALASIAMLFTSLSSAYVVRSGVMNDWFPIAVPRVMFGSTALLVLSSVSIEIARRKLKQASRRVTRRYLLLTRSRPWFFGFASDCVATTSGAGNLSREQSV
jgi:heme/copper-type cytochrome/quinol oxidase subunit 3